MGKTCTIYVVLYCCFELTIISYHVRSNVVTSLRESQAISSLASLRPTLRELILCHPTETFSEYINIKSQIPTVIKSFDGSSGKYKATCPAGVSSKLWSALCIRYNKSQLQAMTSVVEEPRAIYEKYSKTKPESLGNEKASSVNGRADALPPYPLVLLQGPPGTGYVMSDVLQQNPFIYNASDYFCNVI